MKIEIDALGMPLVISTEACECLCPKMLKFTYNGVEFFVNCKELNFVSNVLTEYLDNLDNEKD
jgi:hypothetical protein